MNGRRAIAALGVVVAVVAGLFVAVTSLGRPAPRTEVGVVISIDAVSLTEVRGFEIRTTDGRTIEFRVGQLENGAEFPPGHLGEHQATGVPILVTYRDEDGERVAIRLDDAPSIGPTAAPSPTPTIVAGDIERYLRPVSASSISSGVKISSNDAFTIPSLPTTNTYGSVSMP